MDTKAQPTQYSGSAKKPYQAPELEMMGDAAEMTQNSTNAGADTFGFPNPAAS